MGNCLVIRKDGKEDLIIERFMCSLIDGYKLSNQFPTTMTITTNTFKTGNYTLLIKSTGNCVWGNSNTLTVAFNKEVECVGVIFKTLDDTGAWCKTIALQYSDDGNNWIEIGNKTFEEATYTRTDIIFSSQGGHKMWRILLQSNDENWKGQLLDLIAKF